MSDRFGSAESNDKASGAETQLTGNQFGYSGELDLSTTNYGDSPASKHLKHVSKSRIKTYLKCDRQFAMKYLAGVREPENFYMERGTRIHDSFEAFHKNLQAFIKANREVPSNFTDLMPHGSEWFQFLEYIGPFFEWELDRWEASRENTDSFEEALDVYVPHSMERSLTVDEPPVGTLPWLGPYDLLVHAASVPAVEDTEGLVVVDYKTGSVPDTQYRDKGIHIDLAFYCWILEEHDFDVRAGIGMYPGEGEQIVRENPDVAARSKIIDVIDDFHQKEITREDFDISPQPLCSWCHYQDQCTTPQQQTPEEFRS